MRVGAGKSVIPLRKELLPIERYESVLDELYTRAILIRANIDVLLISVEMTSLQPYAVEQLKQVTASLCGISKENIFIGVTHTFSAPHTRSQEALKKAEVSVCDKNQELLDALVQGVTVACGQALNSLETATVHAGQGEAQINVNRDVETATGYWLGQNATGFSSSRLPVLSFKNQLGQLIAMIYSYDVQSSVIERYDKSLISGDIVGKVSQLLEESNKQAVALYLLGCGADQVPKGEIANVAARDQLAECLVQAIQTTHLALEVESYLSMSSLHLQVAGQVLPDMKSLKPSRTYAYEPTGNRQVRVDLLQLGTVAFVLLQPELASITGAEMARQSPYAITFIATMVNGGQKYMVNEAAYVNRTYEAMNSMFARGAAETVCQAVVDALSQLARKEKNDVSRS